MEIKKIIKWIIFLTLIWIVFSLSNELFIRDWRIKHSEKRVQKSIVENYKNKEKKFKYLIKYVQNLEINQIIEIEFLKGKKIHSYLWSPFISDSIRNNSPHYNLTKYPQELDTPKLEFKLLTNGKARINYTDAIIETNNWYWEWGLKGQNDSLSFRKLIKFLRVSEIEFEVLRNLISEVNCKGISIYKDGSFSIIYDGFLRGRRRYKYLIPKKEYELEMKLRLEEHKDYTKLDKGIFCGSFKYEY